MHCVIRKKKSRTARTTQLEVEDTSAWMEEVSQKGYKTNHVSKVGKPDLFRRVK
jgi:hypothetical protein